MPEAFIGVMLAAEGADVIWGFTTVDGRAVSRGEALLHHERIAAVCHEQLPSQPGARVFREYVLLNESQIAQWEVATPELRTTLEQDVERLTTWAPRLKAETMPASWPALLSQSWERPRSTPIGRYAATLANSADVYQPDGLEALAEALREAKTEGLEPLKVTPEVEFGERPPSESPPDRRNGALVREGGAVAFVPDTSFGGATSWWLPPRTTKPSPNCPRSSGS